MRLKNLTLFGFKTFTPRTELEFGEGLAAIVGPNGSGKSNIADAVRWALGEQSLSVLRAKRTEDLIFAGSTSRAPLGMAEVSITVDNTDRLLPIDFAEVTLTRRAYRSGENEYYINKSRVRLRDVLEIASALGQAYTVVGQGLIDAALSLRPEERRELFEEAAAIRGYFVQREDALRRLTRTEENVARVRDIASELEPQVRRMERQARQAQEYGKLEAELHELMRVWYTGRWALGLQEMKRAQQSEEAAGREVEARKAEMAAKAEQLAEVRNRAWALVAEVSSLHERRAQIQARHAGGSQAQAVLSERLSSAGQQRQALVREQSETAANRKHLESQVRVLRAEADERASEMAALQEEGKDVAARLAALDARVAEMQARYNDESGRFEALTRRQGDLENRLRDTHRQRAEQESAAADAEAAVSSLSTKLSAAEAEQEERRAAQAAAQRAVSESEAAQSTARSTLAQTRSAQADAENARRELVRRADSLNSQLSAVAGEQQASLYSGVRAVVLAASEKKLTGYVGTVAELLRVPGHLETAIESALGGRLQEVVVERWADAERAIAMLKQTGAGRVTFLPLDTIKVSSSPVPPRGPGIVGLARDLVEYDPAHAILAEMVLGRLLIVEDLTSARRTLSAMSHTAPWTLATLDGEVVRPGGSVTGGANTRADDARARGRTILARERRRRELQASQRVLQAELGAAEKGLDRAVAAVSESEAGLARVTAQLEEARKRQASAHMLLMESQNAVSRMHQELSWRTGLLSETRKRVESLVEQASRISEELQQAEQQLEPAWLRVAEADESLRTARSEREQVEQLAGASRTRLAVLSEAARNTQARKDELHREVARHEYRLAELEQRLQAAGQDEAALAAQLEQQSEEVELLAAQLAEIEASIGPSEQGVRVVEGDVSRIEGEQTVLQAAMLESETLFSRAAVERQRCAGVLDSLSIEIGEELGSEEQFAEAQTLRVTTATLEGEQSHQATWDGWPAGLQMGGSHAGNGYQANGHMSVPTEAENAELERKVRALKARISRMGPVNPLALEEYNALADRQKFLQSQLVDLSTAADALRRVIGELDRTMREQLAATFAKVNEAFQYFFSKLFAGGMARLELTDPDDVTVSGVEILAQPPGKRMQPLAALSGGERALTSAALLFALLKVRPVPFCVLDEVDAALDESNVTRFRSALHELGDKTQFIVVTHNRGTIEAASTLYGVSMGGDGTSQILSLKVTQ